MEGNFGIGKIWRIYSINTLAKENWRICAVPWVKRFRKIYSVKHSKRLHWGSNLQRVDVHVFSKFNDTWISQIGIKVCGLTRSVEKNWFAADWEVVNPFDPQAVMVNKEISHMLQVDGHVSQWISSICSILIYSSGERVYQVYSNRHWRISNNSANKILSHKTFFNWRKFEWDKFGEFGEFIHWLFGHSLKSPTFPTAKVSLHMVYKNTHHTFTVAILFVIVQVVFMVLKL